MIKINKPRGTKDIFGSNYNNFIFIRDFLFKITKYYNYQPIITPIFEYKELFIRSISESEIVKKEFFDFKDKSNRELVLRPENTISVIRSIVENNNLYTDIHPLKKSYFGQMFRYERPQSGRDREFWQFGIELIGVKNIFEKIEVICLVNNIFSSLNLLNFIELKINFIGSIDTRNKWILELKKYFNNYKDQLSNDSVKRLETNPLRILDDKIDCQKDFVKKSPKIDKFLSKDEINEWQEIKQMLSKLNIKYSIDENLVRGLDYYNGLVFEVVSKSDKLKGQSTILGGGSYCNLVKELGYEKDYDGIGFAIGIERLLIALNDANLIQNQTNNIDIYFACLNDECLFDSFSIVEKIRKNNFSCQFDFSTKKLNKHFKNSEKLNSSIVLIFGKNEMDSKTIVINDQKNKTKITISLSDLIKKINEILNE